MGSKNPKTSCVHSHDERLSRSVLFVFGTMRIELRVHDVPGESKDIRLETSGGRGRGMEGRRRFIMRVLGL